jgi:hypothetical protein
MIIRLKKKKKGTFPNVGVGDTLAISNVSPSPTLAISNVSPSPTLANVNFFFLFFFPLLLN